jgi:hypothetical protein
LRIPKEDVSVVNLHPIANGVIVMTPPGLHQHRIIKLDGITMTIGDHHPLAIRTTIIIVEEEDGAMSQLGQHPDETLDHQHEILITVIGDRPLVATLEDGMTIMKNENHLDEILDHLVLVADVHLPTGVSFGVATILDGPLPITGEGSGGVAAIPIRFEITTTREVDNPHPAALHEAITGILILPSTSHVPSI